MRLAACEDAGAWVDETTAVRPSSAKGKARDEAERAWRDLRVESGVPAFVFRLGGIYGPGRSVLDAVAAKHAAGVAPATAASKAERGTRKFISRVHVADIVNVLFASVNKVAERGGYGGSSLPLLCVRPEVACRLCCSCLSVLQLLSRMLASG